MRKKSYSTQALKIVLDAAKKYNAQTWLLDLHNTILSMYNPEANVSADGDDNIRKIRDLLNWADAFVLGSPDYHGSISGVSKIFRLLLQQICWKNLWLCLRIS
jgi:FMN reductase